MTDRPIIFSAPMIRALLDGRKTQTRRILKPQPMEDRGMWFWRDFAFCDKSFVISSGQEIARQIRYAPGDCLWVRETWKPHSIYADRAPRDIPNSKIFYRADDGYAPSNMKWVPPIHMPRWASRLTLIVESVKVERLQEISEEDAWAEGIEAVDGLFDDEIRALADEYGISIEDARTTFAALWESIRGKRAWAANPWVIAISFRVVKANIDTLANKAP